MPYADPDEARRYARERMRGIRKADPAPGRAASRAYYARNKEACREKSRLYRENNQEQLRATRRHQSSRNRAKLRGAFVEDVSHRVVFEKDDNVCQGCQKVCDPDADRFASNKATLDHVVPLARGGEHSYANVQTLCWPCNHVKRDR